MSLKACLILILVVIALCAWPARAAAPETITGEVISLSCYFQDRANVGKAGAVCAIATVKWEGNPAGLLTAAGKVYQITGGLAADNNLKIVPLLGLTVTITGDVYVKDGMQMIAADDAKAAK